jgi:hypothetical protein
MSLFELMSIGRSLSGEPFAYLIIGCSRAVDYIQLWSSHETPFFLIGKIMIASSSEETTSSDC